MTPEFTLERLREAARGRRAPVKSFLLDQRRIAGVGNIYADEALFRARIHPLRPAGALNRKQLAALRDAVEEALLAGIESKGASIDDFRHVDGARGSFQDRFLVHRREGEPCPRCGTQDPQAGGGRARHLRLRALPAAAAREADARRALGGLLGREQLGEPPGAVRRQQLIEAADRLSPITICGKVNIPVSSASFARLSGSRDRLISS